VIHLSTTMARWRGATWRVVVYLLLSDVFRLAICNTKLQTLGTAMSRDQLSFRRTGEQWERWRIKRKLMSGSKHRGASARVTGVLPPVKFFFEIVSNVLQYSAFWPENAFLNTLTMGTAFLRVPPGNDPWSRSR